MGPFDAVVAAYVCVGLAGISLMFAREWPVKLAGALMFLGAIIVSSFSSPVLRVLSMGLGVAVIGLLIVAASRLLSRGLAGAQTTAADQRRESQKCLACGADFSDGISTCPSCGWTFEDADDRAPEKELRTDDV